MKPVLFLLSENSDQDKSHIKTAFETEAPGRRYTIVTSIDQLNDYLHHTGAYAGLDASPRPGIVVLDLDLDRGSARKALQIIKTDPDLRRLPVLLLSSSEAEEEVFGSYDAGVNAFVTRPSSVEEWLRLARGIEAFWFKIARLPD